MATFCLLHGKWHSSSCWEPLVDSLRERCHDALAPDLPFHDARADYDERARPAVTALVGAADPVVVVGHSLGAAYAPLVAMRRPNSLLVYLCPAPAGVFARSNAPMTAGRAGFPFPPEGPDGSSVWDPEAAIDAMYRRLPPDIARPCAAQLRPGAPPPGDYPLARHPDVASVLIFASEDEFFEPAWERYVAREILGVEPIEIPGGHFPMLESPRTLAELLSRLAHEHEAALTAA